MDKTVFTGYNEETYLLVYPDPDKRWIHGKPDEIADLLGETLTNAIIQDPQLRRPLIRSMWRVRKNTLPEILRYWLEGWPFTVIGAAVLFGIMYGFAALMHALGA